MFYAQAVLVSPDFCEDVRTLRDVSVDGVFGRAREDVPVAAIFQFVSYPRCIKGPRLPAFTGSN